MATYSVYDNILIKLENIFLKVEAQVDNETASLLSEHNKFSMQLTSLKKKLESLNSVRRIVERYGDDESEIQRLRQSIFKTICDKQIQLRLLQEKELVLKGALSAGYDASSPIVVLLNSEFNIRKQLQEVELLSSFLIEQKNCQPYLKELKDAYRLYDLAVENGAKIKLEQAINVFYRLFEKITYDNTIESDFINSFKAQILLATQQVSAFSTNDIQSISDLPLAYRNTKKLRINADLEVDKLMYQFAIMQEDITILLAEIKNISIELESVIFKEYAIKQKLRELKLYKNDLNHQKETFMQDPCVDSYAVAVKQLEQIEYRFKRLTVDGHSDKQVLANRFFTTNKLGRAVKLDSTYNKALLQVLHNGHICADDKATLLRLSKSSRIINSNDGKVFYQRVSKTLSLPVVERMFDKLQSYELH